MRRGHSLAAANTPSLLAETQLQDKNCNESSRRLREVDEEPSSSLNPALTLLSAAKAHHAVLALYGLEKRHIVSRFKVILMVLYSIQADSSCILLIFTCYRNSKIDY
jgi:hypothetical protein